MDKKTQKTYDILGKAYLDEIADDIPKELQEFIGLIPRNGRVLDVGCAGGRDSALFVAQGFDVVGIDLSELFLKEARKHVPSATFQKMDVSKLTFPENHFDAVWASAVLLHLKKGEMPKALKNLLHVLKEGGVIHIRVKEGDGERYVQEKLSKGHERFFAFYKKGELEEKMEDIGFNVFKRRTFSDEIGREGVRLISIWAEK